MNLDNQIIGGMINSPSFLDVAITKLKADYFQGHCKELFEAMQEMYNDRERIDLLTVSIKVKDKIPAYDVSAIGTNDPHANSVYQLVYAKIEDYIKNDIESYAVALQGKSSTMDVFDLAAELKEKIKDIEGALSPEKQRSIKDIVKSTIEEINEASKNNGVIGARTGFKDLDRVFHGLRPSELIVLAGRPAMGKTTLATEICRRATKLDQKVLFFTMEMGETELMKKLLSAESHVQHDKLMSGNLHQHEWEQINSAISRVMNENLIIHNKGGINEIELGAVARKQMRENGLDLIVIDYLQLMSCSDPKKEATLNMKITHLSGQMKALAMDLKCPIILLSQLSRAVETRNGDGKPINSDLRDSGSIEQDANMIWFVYRPEVYGIEQTEQGESTQNYMEVIVSKNRRGRCGSIPLRCDLSKSLVEDFE